MNVFMATLMKQEAGKHYRAEYRDQHFSPLRAAEVSLRSVLPFSQGFVLQTSMFPFLPG